MLIDPQGLFYGERIGNCSDEARLHFPHLLAASNGHGRIEMSYARLAQTVYGSFKRKPAKDRLTAMFREFHSNFLLFVYQAQDGSVWGQWDIPHKYLPRFKTAADNASPAPPRAEYDAFRHCYVESCRARYDLAGHFGDLPKSAGRALPKAEVPVPVAPDPRHAHFRAEVNAHWQSHVSATEDAPWDGSEGRHLAALLKARPAATVDWLRRCLANRALSDVALTERPRRWLESVGDYEAGPLDRFGKPKGLGDAASTGGGVAGRQQRSDGAIADGFAPYLGGEDAGAGADAADEERLPVAGDHAGNGSDVGASLAHAGGELRAGGDAAGAGRTHAAVTVLSPASGTSGGAGCWPPLQHSGAVHAGDPRGHPAT